MRRIRTTVISLMGATAAVLATASTSTADVGTERRVTVLGTAEVDTHDPYSVFGFSVHAQGNGRSGEGVVWMSHHNDEQVAWMVARVDCVRAEGRVAVVTAVVSDAQDFAVAVPGEPIALTVRDNGRRDTIGFASREQVTKCRGAEPETRLSRGDFRILS